MIVRNKFNIDIRKPKTKFSNNYIWHNDTIFGIKLYKRIIGINIFGLGLVLKNKVYSGNTPSLEFVDEILK